MHDGEQLALRIGWDDPEPNDVDGLATFWTRSRCSCRAPRQPHLPRSRWAHRAIPSTSCSGVRRGSATSATGPPSRTSTPSPSTTCRRTTSCRPRWRFSNTRVARLGTRCRSCRVRRRSRRSSPRDSARPPFCRSSSHGTRRPRRRPLERVVLGFPLARGVLRRRARAGLDLARLVRGSGSASGEPRLTQAVRRLGRAGARA